MYKLIKNVNIIIMKLLPNLTLKKIKFCMWPIFGLGISVIYIQIIAVGSLGYQHDECGDYIP